MTEFDVLIRASVTRGWIWFASKTYGCHESMRIATHRKNP